MRDEHYFSVCDAVAIASKDPSTQLGALIVGPGGEIRSTGYNGMPRKVKHLAPRIVRPEKYKWFVHAEANAVFNAARCGTPVLGCRLYCQWPPCPNCAMAIIQSGIVEVVVRSFTVPERWEDDMQRSYIMLEEAGVQIRDLAGVLRT